MRELKQQTIAKEKEINGNIFYIRPFSSFTAANMSGEIIGLIAPALTGALPLLTANGEADVMNLDARQFSGALSSLSGDKVESVLKKLLTKHNNISVKPVDSSDDEAEILNLDLANEIFCGSAQDMFILAYEVVKVNFTGFFEKVGNLFGGRKVVVRKTQ